MHYQWLIGGSGGLNFTTSEMQNMVRTTINMDESLDREVENRLSYGDSKSQWIRNSIKLRLEVDSQFEEIPSEEEYDERIAEVLDSLSSNE